MPGLKTLQTSLREVLAVRGGPLSEPEIWASLCQTASSLLDLINHDLAYDPDTNLPAYIISPDTLMLCGDGQVDIAESVVGTYKKSRFVAPELASGMVLGELEAEKTYIYGLGMTMYAAVDYKQKQEQSLNISRPLDSVLYSMCETKVERRISLSELMQVCQEYGPTHTHKHPYSEFILKLHQLVFGTPDMNSGSDGEDLYRLADDLIRSGHEKSRHHRSHDQLDQLARSHDQLHQLGGQPRSRSRGRRRSKHSSSASSQADRPRSYHEAVGASDRSTINSPYSASADLHLRGNLHSPYSASADQLNRPHRLTRLPLGDSARSYQDLRGSYQASPAPTLTPPPSAACASNALYERLYGRRKRLEVLRNGLLYDQRDSVSNASGQSYDPHADRNSLTSATSYNQGVFRPDWSSRYGPDTGLRLKTSSEQADSDYSTDMPLVFPDRNRLANGDAPHLGPTTLQATDHHQNHRPPSFSELTSQPPNHSPSNEMTSRHVSQSQNSLHRLDNQSTNSLQKSNRPVTQSQPGLNKSAGQSGTPSRIEGPPLGTPTNQRTPPTNLNVRPSPAVSRVSHKSATTPQTPTRTFLGPEFVCQASKPPILVQLPHVQSLKSGTQLRPARIVLLNGQALDIPCDVSTTIKHVYDAIIGHLNLNEHFYFGLTCISEGEHMFIDSTTKFTKLAGSTWKDPKSGHSDRPFMLYFRVKFYPEDLATLKHSLTPHLFYLQLRRDLLEERVHCCEDDALDLAAWALQAECGDWSASLGKNYFYAEHYIPQRIIRRVGSSFIKDKLPRLHKEKLGHAQPEAEYLKEVQLLNEYGCHFYRIWKSKQERNVPMWAGVGVNGLVITEKHLESRYHLFRWPWNQVQNLAFNRRKFSVQPKSDSKSDKPMKLTFYTESYKKGRYLLQFSTQQHNFQLKQQVTTKVPQQVFHDAAPEPQPTPPRSTLVATPNGEHDNHGYTSEEGDDDGKSGSPQASPQPPRKENSTGKVKPIKRMKVDRIEMGFPIRTIPTPVAPPVMKQPSTTVYQETFDYQTSLDLASPPVYHAPSPDVHAPPPRAGDRSPPGHHDEDDYHDYLDEPDRSAYVVDASIKSRDHTLYPTALENETVSETLRERLDNLSVSEPAPERIITLVKLEKDPLLGVGITIVGGENANHLDLGIFVKNITPEGPAQLSGLVNPGDRIIAINGRSLEGITHLRAVELIRDSDSPVHFLLSQPAQPTPGLGELIMKSKIPTSSSASFKSSKTPTPSRNSRRNSLEQNGLDFKRLTRYDLDSSSESVSVQGEGTPSHRVACLPPGAVYEVLLRKNDRGSFGFNVEGGVNTGSSQGGVYIESLVPGGPAHIDGRMLVGDRLLEVNGVPLSGVSHHQAVTALRHAPDTCKLTLEKGHKPSRIDYSFVNQENTYVVRLVKDQHGLGFSIIGGRDEAAAAEPHDVIPRIKKVFSRGPAHECGRLEPGDVLLEVKDKAVKDLTHSEIISLLRGAESPVRLKFCRPKPGILPSTTPSSGETTPNQTHSDIIVHETFEKTQASPKNTDWKRRPEFSRTQRLDTYSPSSNRKTPRGSPSPPPSQLVRPISSLSVAPPRKQPVIGHNYDATPPKQTTNQPKLSAVSKEDDKPKIIELALHKDRDSGGLGFRIDNNEEEPGCHVSSIIAEPALSDGRLKQGDKVLVLNDVDVSHYDRATMSETLEMLPERVAMRVLRDPKHEYESYAQITDPEKYDLIRVDLRKPSSGTLGIAISGVEKVTNKRGIFIKSVTKDSPAEKDGRIRIGDRLVQVNGESVLNVKVKQAVAVLKNAKSDVSLVVCRPKQHKSPTTELSPPRSVASTLDRSPSPVRAEKLSPAHSSPMKSSPGLSRAHAPSHAPLHTPNHTPSHNPPPSYNASPRLPRLRLDSPPRSSYQSSPAPSRRSQPGTPSLPRPATPTRVCPVSPSRISSHTDTTSVAPDEHEALEYLMDSVRPYYDELHSDSKSDLRSTTPEPEPPALKPFRDDDIRMESKWDNFDPSQLDDDDLDLDLDPPQPEVEDRRHLLPDPLTDSWVRGLPIIEPVDSEQYSDSMLPTMIRGLREFLDTDEPYEEYKDLRDMDAFDSTDTAKKAENKTLNRYRNVLPYDTCRVKLVNTENDYVNASYVQYRLNDKAYTYIAAQGPLAHTTEDFWLMAWQNDVSVIAMTTKDMEDGKSKCHRYWPDNTEKTIQVYERYRVGFTKLTSLYHFDVRELWMEDVQYGIRRQIYQLCYKTWPDHDIPESAVPLMRYLKLVHLYHTTGPVLAHCSAGIGRTGVMITVDVAMKHIETGVLFDIFKIVKRIRTQRPGMIQTKDQYIFCYQACLEALYSMVKDTE